MLVHRVKRCHRGGGDDKLAASHFSIHDGEH